MAQSHERAKIGQAICSSRVQLSLRMFKDDDACCVEPQTIFNGCSIALLEPMRQSRFWVFVADHLYTIWNKRRAGRAAQMREHLPLVGKAPGINIRRLAYRTWRVQMQRPPSTSSATPVIILASSEHRKLAAWPISCVVEKRPSGIVERLSLIHI